MITTILPRTTPTPSIAGLAVKLLGEVQLADIPTVDANDVDPCDLDCPYKEKVFAHSTDTDFWKNDKSSFENQKVIAADTIVYKIVKDGVEIETITDDTFGEFYNGFTNQPLYVFFVVYWKNVFDTHGSGSYFIRTEKTIVGKSTTTDSRCFQLIEYTDKRANRTTRIESYQSGNIERSQFDYTDLVEGGWYSSYRIAGILQTPQSTKVTDNYHDQDWQLQQIQDSIEDEWTLQTELLPSEITTYLRYNLSLANRVLITDYNIYAHELYRRVPLYLTGLEKSDEWAKQPKRAYELTFNDKVQNIIKRNY